jgi:hypothetical protein
MNLEVVLDSEWAGWLVNVWELDWAEFQKAYVFNKFFSNLLRLFLFT